jgi:hypothetical protein
MGDPLSGEQRTLAAGDRATKAYLFPLDTVVSGRLARVSLVSSGAAKVVDRHFIFTTQKNSTSPEAPQELTPSGPS